MNKRLITLVSVALAMMFCMEPARADLLNASGKLTLLRVHDVGTGFGPAGDQIDGEVIIKLNTQQGKSFGFTLRNDANSLTHQGMLDLLRDAWKNDWTVHIDYEIDSGKNNGRLFRLWVSK